ncbi:hypothetical protein [Haloechinothrix halophila]|uniref:DUF445 domain-containing protein n=1 Tax=Haloechinothrix halophila YIM 93223 TaxID=592678 RepID=W9DN80_9PSEU|nr:hypothetical protein [Haloechinothrix halophila]ETA66325.1 hypothetical protein AmyhaDRAFT_0079 [Haloechinothrix halophila YIM 93223]
MEQELLLHLITIPLFTGVIGYITNWTGVLMLFQPLKFHGIRIPGLKILFPFLPRRVQVIPAITSDGRFGWQGIVPSRAAKMASIAVDKGLAKLGSISDFYRELEPDKIAERLTEIAELEIRDVVERIMMREEPQLWNDLPPQVKDVVHARVVERLPKLVRELTDEIGANIDQLLDAKLMVMRHLEQHPELLNDMFRKVGKKELTFMQNFGFYFGYPMGFLLVWVVEMVPQWWVLPVGGVIIGYVVNYLGIMMIFEPVRRTKWVPWKQGLFIKRKDEISDVYAKIISDNVITINNVGNELLHGPRSDRTHQMLEKLLWPTIDRAVGPARPAVRMVVGSRSYDRIRQSVATESTRFAPRAFGDEEFNVRQANKIFRFVADQMRRMSLDDFNELLRSAIKQDEWLLFVHGAVLGAGAGFLHLAIFGV